MAKLNTYFPDPTEATPATDRLIFGKYAAKYGTEATWLTDFSANILDIDYLFSRSGEKWASPFLEKLSAISEDPQRDLPNYWLAERIADVLHNRYTEQWNRLYAAMFADYNPIENYSMEEKTVHGHIVTDGGTDSVNYGKAETHTGTDTTTYGKATTQSGTDSTVHGHAITTDSKSDAVQQDSIYGFNTSAPATPTASVGVSTSGGTDTFTTSDNRGVPSTASLGGNKGSGSETHSGTDQLTYGKKETDSGTDQLTHGHVVTDSGTDSTQYGKTETHSGTDTLTRAGNIGVTTSQQMIESEILLRERNRFLEVVYNNVDELLALSIY